MIKITNLLLLICGIGLYSCNNGSDDENLNNTTEKGILLRFNPKEGQTHKMNYVFSVVNDSTGDKTSFSIQVANEIKKVNDGKISLELLYTGASMTAFLQGKEVKLNANAQPSENSQANLVAAPVFVFVNKKVEFEYDQQFRKIKETILDIDSVPSLQNTESKVQFIARYPDHELKVGQTWNSDLELKVGNKNIENASFTLKSISDTDATIEVTADIDTKGEKFGHEFNMKGKLSGKFIVDRKTGWQNQGNLELEFTLSMMGNNTPMKQSISFGLE